MANIETISGVSTAQVDAMLSDEDSFGKSNLNEPLLKSDQSQSNGDGAWVVPLNRLKLLSFITGSIVAIVSQALLFHLLWTPTKAVSASVSQVILLSLVWSFFACAIIFVFMTIFVSFVKRCFYEETTTCKIANVHKESHINEHFDDEVFQIEAYHIIGSLLSISFTWVVVDIMLSLVPSSFRLMQLPTLHRCIMYSIIAIAWYFIFVKCLLCRSTKKRQQYLTKEESALLREASALSLVSTYQLVAATLGLVSGMCSQFLLTSVFWRDHMILTIFNNTIALSATWSLCSVGLTYAGCLFVRTLVSDDSGVNGRVPKESIFLRMERQYIFTSLIGICLAWVIIDMILDMKDQIIPSILALGLSTGVFGAIVTFFPGDKCSIEAHATATDDNSTPNSKRDSNDLPVIQIV